MSGFPEHPAPKPTLADLLAQLLAMLPHNGIANTFSTGIVLGLAAGTGFCLVCWAIQNVPQLIPH